MKKLNDQEWKELQEKVKKIDVEGSQHLIGVHFFVGFISMTKNESILKRG